MPAGPSELMVVADDAADPRVVAADLLSQAEHDASAQVLLVTPSAALAAAVEAEVRSQVRGLPRSGTAEASLEHARIILAPDLGQCVEIANLYAPEHLSLAVRDPDELLPSVRNAGAVFAGMLAAETFGDYIAGSSHVLPTDGAARAWSGVSVHTFLKAMTGTDRHGRCGAADRGAGGGAGPARRAGGACQGCGCPGGEGAGMTSLARRLARPEILALAPFDIAAQANDAFGADAIKLDANENPYPPLSEGALATGLNRYPEPQPARLKRAMAALYGVAPEEIAVTRGADDAIDILVRAFCRPGADAVSICTPTFSAYAHFARLQGARLIEAKLDAEFDFDVESFLDSVRKEPSLKLAFICSPNNPTGNPVDPADVLRVADELPETIVVLDEAYLEFSETPSLAAEAVRRPNLAILKTLSKAYGLAGARVGALIGNADLVEVAGRALPPYPLPSLSIEAAMAALAPARRPIHAERIARIKADRERLAPLFAGSPLVKSVRSGGGNFLFSKWRSRRRLRASSTLSASAPASGRTPRPAGSA
jgi:histidinol-phosphate aminotransferase